MLSYLLINPSLYSLRVHVLRPSRGEARSKNYVIYIRQHLLPRGSVYSGTTFFQPTNLILWICRLLTARARIPFCFFSPKRECATRERGRNAAVIVIFFIKVTTVFLIKVMIIILILSLEIKLHHSRASFDSDFFVLRADDKLNSLRTKFDSKSIEDNELY